MRHSTDPTLAAPLTTHEHVRFPNGDHVIVHSSPAGEGRRRDEGRPSMSTPTMTRGQVGREAAWAANRAATAARLEDLEFLLAVGESFEPAAARCGWTPEAARRAVSRHATTELAAAVARATRTETTR